VKYEPVYALDGGRDGLDFYRSLSVDAPLFLRKGGLLALEIGYNQAENVGDILLNGGKFSRIEIIKDLAQKDRVVLATNV